MKKIIPLLLIACMLLSSCGTPEPIDTGIKETITAEPYPEMLYNGTPIKLKEAKLIQILDESVRYYHPMLILHFDFSQVEEYQKNRMFKTDMSLPIAVETHRTNMKEFDVDVEFNSPKNEIKYKNMSLITFYTDGDEVVYIFYEYSGKMANDLLDIELEFIVDIVQDEKYQTKDGEYRKVNTYTYELEDLPIQDESVITQTEADMFSKGIKNIINSGLAF